MQRLRLCHHVILAVLCCVAVCMVPVWGNWPVPLGDMTASSEYVLVGENLTITCSLKKNSNASGMAMSVWFNDRNMPVITVNPWTVQLVRKDLTVKDSGAYYCWLGEELVSSIDIFVEYPVRQVENVSCMIYNWDSMNCSWSLGINYTYPKDIIVTLQWFCMGFTEARECPSLHQTYCYWKEVYGSPGCALNITVQNNVTQKAASVIKPIRTYDIVKPAPVQLGVENVNQSCVVLHWNHSEVERVSDMQFRVFQKEGNGPEKLVKQGLKETGFSACELHPATAYTFLVECFPRDDTKGFWSNPASVSVTTLEDVPGQGPSVTVGSFDSDPLQCTSQGVRQVIVFWKAVPRQVRNGVVTGYTLHSGDLWRELGGDQYSFRLELACNASYSVELYANTSVGMSSSYSTLQIPKVSNKADISIQEFLIDITNDTVEAEWMLSGGDGNVTLFWCTLDNDMKCKGEIDWTTVSGDAGSQLLPLERRQVLLYRYGIATSSSSSGITWTNCLADYSAKPEEPIKGLKLRPGDTKGTLRVQWFTPECSYRNNVIVKAFRLYLCEDSCSDVQKRTFEVGGNVSEYLLADLVPGAEYIVQIQAVAAGGEGPLSQPIAHTAALEDTINYLYVAAPVAGGIIVLMAILCTGICICRRKYKERKQKMTISYPDIKNPVESGYKMFVATEEVLASDQSGNSGVGSMPTSSTILEESPSQPVCDVKVQNGSLPTVRFANPPHKAPNRKVDDYCQQNGVLRNGYRHFPDTETAPSAEIHLQAPTREEQHRPVQKLTCADEYVVGMNVTSGIGDGLEIGAQAQDVNEIPPERSGIMPSAPFSQNPFDAAVFRLMNSGDYVDGEEESSTHQEFSKASSDPVSLPEGDAEPDLEDSRDVESVDATSSSVLPSPTITDRGQDPGEESPTPHLAYCQQMDFVRPRGHEADSMATRDEKNLSTDEKTSSGSSSLPPYVQVGDSGCSKVGTRSEASLMPSAAYVKLDDLETTLVELKMVNTADIPTALKPPSLWLAASEGKNGVAHPQEQPCADLADSEETNSPVCQSDLRKNITSPEEGGLPESGSANECTNHCDYIRTDQIPENTRL